MEKSIMETLDTLRDETIIRENYLNTRIRGPFRLNGGWFLDLQYTEEAAAAMRPVVTPRTELGSLPRPIVPIPDDLARELGLPDQEVGLDR
jgi:hypothetical protein